MSKRTRRATAAVLASTALCALPSPTRAIQYVGSNNSNWASFFNWQEGEFPVDGSSAEVVAGAGNTPFVVNYNYDYTPAHAVGMIQLNSPDPAPLILQQTAAGFDLYSASETVGTNGRAVHNHSANLNSTGTLSLAPDAGGTGTYSLSGTATLAVAGTTTVGGGNVGSFSQSAGSFTTSSLVLADAPGSAAQYSLTGGSVTASTATSVANSGTAVFSQSGGTHSTPTLTISAASAGQGTYSLSGTSALTTTTTTVGSAGAGSFAQSAGAHTTGTLVLGNLAGSAGNYSLTGGTLSAKTETRVAAAGSGTFSHAAGTLSTPSLAIATAAAGIGTYSLSATGSLAVNGDAKVGAAGSGTLAQSGGTASVANELSLAAASGSTALYALSGGSMTAGSVAVGGSKSTPGGAGTLSVTGGALTVTGALRLFASPGTSLNLAGGTLTVQDLQFPSPAAPNFTWTAGTLNFSAGYTVNASFALGPDITLAPNATLAAGAASTNAGTITLAGGSLSGPATLTNSALIQGYGTLAQPLRNDNLLAQSNGGNLTISAPFTNSPTGTLRLTPARTTTLNAPLSNSGFLQLNGATVAGPSPLTNTAAGTLVGPGTLSAPFTNDGYVLLESGLLSLPATSATTSTGVIELDGPAAVLAGGPLTNTGTLHGRGRVSNPVTNAGTVEPVDGILTLTAPLTNSPGGTLRTTAATKLLASAGITNAGTIALAGGTLSTTTLANSGAITGFGALATSSLSNDGTITLSGAPTTVTGPVTNNATGTIKVENQPAVFTHPVVNNGTLLVTNTTATFAAGLTGPVASEPASLSIDAASNVIAPAVTQSSLTNAGLLTLLPTRQGGSPSTLASLTLLPGSAVDLADNALTVTDTPAATIRQYLFTNRLTSSAADPTHRLGYLDTSATFSGEPSAPSSLTIKLTLTGDANLDGRIDPDDYALVDRGFAKSGSLWSQGDFDYDGSVNSADYLLIDTTYGQAQGFSPGFLSQRESQFGPAYVSSLLASVPEPTPSSILYPLSSLFLLSRRRFRGHPIAPHMTSRL